MKQLIAVVLERQGRPRRSAARADDRGQDLRRAFAQIAAELRHQYVLTYYTDELPDDRGQKITVRVKDRKDVEVRAVFAWDQMS